MTMTSPVISLVLTTVAASYGVEVSARELADRIQDPASATAFDAPTFAFFSEVSPRLQAEFIEEMGVSRAAAIVVATLFSEAAGYALPLAVRL
jgi:hypothetical protein